jgi:toxin ParE1/3/4
MKLRLTPQARGDLDDIVVYLDQRSPAGARNVMRAIYAGIDFIQSHPEASQRTEHPSVRVCVVRRYRYKIFYCITADAIEILHVRHTSRRSWGGEGE